MGRMCFVPVLALVVVGCGGGGATDAPPGDGGHGDGAVDLGGHDGATDGGGMDGTTMCSGDSQCDDGLFCSGTERCAPFTVGADAHGCVAGTPPCPAAMCMETAHTCASGCPDNDGDGHHDLACGGDDCDDTDPRRYPSNPEVCDTHDEDCDPTTLGPDHDGDGYVSITCCNGSTCGLDCDDTRPTVHPTAVESCNGVDDDCNGLIDDGVQLTFYRDVDGDGFGRNDMTMMGCSLITGYAFMGNDCDDMNMAVHPGTTEVCDGIDNDCDGMVDPMCACTDGSSQTCGDPSPSGGFLSTGICTIGLQTCAGGAWSVCIGATFHTTEICNMMDDDCDGTVDNGVDVECYVDADNDAYAPGTAVVQRLCPSSDPARVSYGRCPMGYTGRQPTDLLSTDCADSLHDVHPGGTEICNGLDDDCNGVIDDGSGAPRTCYVDNDDDGFSPSTTGAVMMCACPVHTTTVVPGAGTTDCNDGVMTIHPGAVEICDPAPSHDENCNGMTNEGCACTPGATQMCMQPGVCAMGMQTCISMGATSGYGPCSIAPSTELCDGLDNDCNGLSDETFACRQGTTQPCTRAACGAMPGLSGSATCDTSCHVGACIATEVCNGCDDNVNGLVDEGFTCALGATQGCATACGTSGNQPCNGTCSGWGACHAATETCNFCDDVGDGGDDRLVGGTRTATGTYSGGTCTGLTWSGTATCGKFNSTGTPMVGDFGTLSETGTVKVGWSTVSATANLVLNDALGDGVAPTGTIEVYLTTGGSLVARRTVGVTWDIGGAESMQFWQLSGITRTNIATIYQGSVIGEINWNTWDSDEWLQQYTLTLQYRPAIDGMQEQFNFVLTLGGTSWTLPSPVTFATPMLSPGVSVFAAANASVDGGPWNAMLYSGGGITATALDTCP